MYKCIRDCMLSLYCHLLHCNDQSACSLDIAVLSHLLCVFQCPVCKCTDLRCLLLNALCHLIPHQFIHTSRWIFDNVMINYAGRKKFILQSEMDSLRPWPWPRGQLTMSVVLALDLQSLALALALEVVIGLV